MRCAGAGWGAQVLEQPNAGVVIFADVDLKAIRESFAELDRNLELLRGHL